MSWVSLHTHSQYSILDSTISVKDLAKNAAALQMPAVAITDTGNLYGAIDFYKACKAEGIKPIIGIEILVAPTSRFEKKKAIGVPYADSLILLAINKEGYKNLCKLSSIGFTEGFYYTPRVDREMLSLYKEGLICLSGAIGTRLGREILEERSYQEELLFLQDTYGKNFYIEIQRHPIDYESFSQESWLQIAAREYGESQEKLNKTLLQICNSSSISPVATNDVHYLEKSDWKAHEILMNIQTGEPVEIWEKDAYGNPKSRMLNPKRRVLHSHDHYFKSPQEMEKLFHDIPEAIENTQKITEKCNLELDFKTKHYPVFYPPGTKEGSISDKEREVAAANFLRELCAAGIPIRYTKERLEKVGEKYPGKDPMQVVHDRLAYELDVILSKGLCDYLLIVHDFISWAKSQSIPVGPGRGSGAGSIILYLIGITDIEPLRFNLFFERFINPERLSYPDIDVDICMDRRSEVIEYTLHKYGKDKVAQIITFGTMKAKMAIKDVGRMLSVPLAKVNEIAKLVPEDPTITLEKAIEVDVELRNLIENDKEVRELISIARILEGSIRNTGVHAAGLIISATPLTDSIPICVPKDAEIVTTQYSMKPVESVGMLKIDFLGLKTLTSIQKAVDAISMQGSKKIDWINLPLEDATTFDLLNQGKTQGVFQLESSGMQDLARNLHIDKFEEIIAVGALYRPGPMEMIPSFIARKHGKEPIELDHEWMKEIIEETYGIMVYQEQVMQIAQKLARYSLGEGDVLRRAMGKKDHEEMAKQRQKFKEGAESQGIDSETAMRIFDKIEKFASYGFNKSHAAAYGYLSYVTAYLKANHPREWFASLMTCDSDDLTKVAKHIREAQSMGIDLLAPDINESGMEFTATSQGIRFALSGIKGVGEGVVQVIIDERKKNGPFDSIFTFLSRIDTKKVGKKAIESLIESGAFDFSKQSRKGLLSVLPALFEAQNRIQKEQEKGVLDFFQTASGSFSQTIDIPEQEWSAHERVSKEKELLGVYLTGHPLDPFKPLYDQLSCVSFEKIHELSKGSLVRICAIVDEVKMRIAQKSGRKFALVTISDGIERFEMPIWPALFEQNPHLYQEGSIVYALIEVDLEEGAISLKPRWIAPLTSIDEKLLKECDEAYAHAKSQQQMEKMREKKGDGGKEGKKQTTKRLHLVCDADVMRLSTIIEIKKIFSKHAGTSPALLEFIGNNQRVGIVEILPDWGVFIDKGIEKSLAEVSGIKEIRVEVLE